MPRSPGFAPPLNELGKTGLGAPYVARSATGGMGLALDDKGKVPPTVLPSQVIDRAQATANVNTTATSEGTATTILTSNTVLYDGGPVEIEFYAPNSYHSAGVNYIKYVLLMDTTVLGQMHQVPGANGDHVTIRAKHTPAVGEHFFVVKAFVDAGTGTVAAGAGGSGNLLPMFIEVTRG